MGSNTERGEKMNNNIFKVQIKALTPILTGDAKKEVITPLKRDTRTPAKAPINLEVIEPGREGEFYLLYFPYPKDEIKEENIKNDLGFLGRALALMFYTYGFSAKKNKWVWCS